MSDKPVPTPLPFERYWTDEPIPNVYTERLTIIGCTYRRQVVLRPRSHAQPAVYYIEWSATR